MDEVGTVNIIKSVLESLRTGILHITDHFKITYNYTSTGCASAGQLLSQGFPPVWAEDCEIGLPVHSHHLEKNYKRETLPCVLTINSFMKFLSRLYV